MTSKEQANAFKKHRDAEDPQGNLAWAARLGQKALRAGPEALARIDVEREFELNDSEKVLWRLLKLARKYLDLEFTGVLPQDKCRAFFRGLVAADVVDIVDVTEAKALLPAEVKRLKAEIAGKEIARAAPLKARVYRPDIDGPPAGATGTTGPQPVVEVTDSIPDRIPDVPVRPAPAPIERLPTPMPSPPRTSPSGSPMAAMPRTSSTVPTSASGHQTVPPASRTQPRGIPAIASLDGEQSIFKGEIDRAYAAMPKQNHYEFMGLTSGVDDATVRQHYMRLAREYHPDKVASGGYEQATRDKVDSLFKRLGEAHEKLGSAELRATYDRTLEALGDNQNTAASHGKKQRRPAEANNAFKMAETYFKKKDFKQAEAHYKQAVNFDGEDPKILTALAYCIWQNPDHEEGQRTAEARKRFTEIVTNHRYGDAAYKLGLLLRKGNDEAGAQRQIALAFKLDPSHTDAQREVRLVEMRHNKAKDEKEGGGLFGKFLKK